MTQVIILYTTFPDTTSARQIGRLLIEEQLAACVNILPSMHSIYAWEGKVEEAEEAVMLIKTTIAKEQAVIERVKSLHLYSCPCVIVWPVSGGNEAFLNWIKDSVK